MSSGWRERLREVIKGDGRSLRALSAAANEAGNDKAHPVGENYLQQVLKDEKDPGFSRLAKVLSVLGPEATVYVTSGGTLDPERHLRVALVAFGITDDEDLTTALNVARTLSGRKTAGTQEPRPDRDRPQRANLPREVEPSELPLRR